MISIRELVKRAESLEEVGEYTKAERLHERALRHAARRYGNMSPELSPYLYNLGMIQAALEKYYQAEKTLVKLISLLEPQLGPDHKEISELKNVLLQMSTDESEAPLALNA